MSGTPDETKDVDMADAAVDDDAVDEVSGSSAQVASVCFKKGAPPFFIF